MTECQLSTRLGLDRLTKRRESVRESVWESVELSVEYTIASSKASSQSSSQSSSQPSRIASSKASEANMWLLTYNNSRSRYGPDGADDIDIPTSTDRPTALTMTTSTSGEHRPPADKHDKTRRCQCYRRYQRWDPNIYQRLLLAEGRFSAGFQSCLPSRFSKSTSLP